MKKKITAASALLITAILFLNSCSIDIEELLYGPSGNNPISQTIETEQGIKNPEKDNSDDHTEIVITDEGKKVNLTVMRVISDSMSVYAEESVESASVKTYQKDQNVTVEVTTSAMWRVYEGKNPVGYCRLDDVIYEDAVYYAELPVEYGVFTNGYGKTYTGTSHLVDVRKYNDLLETPMVIDMILRTYVRKDGTPFYTRNLCLLLYDTLIKLLKAQAQFVAAGYTIKIYDAYRPTSVQWAWFEKVGVHKWVASPDIGDGSIHDRGIAVDISLVNIATGEEIETPTPMHTFSDLSARGANGQWSYWAKYYVEQLMTPIMTACGFDHINSEWWHYQDSNKNLYLPTDHPIDSIPLVQGG